MQGLLRELDRHEIQTATTGRVASFNIKKNGERIPTLGKRSLLLSKHASSYRRLTIVGKRVDGKLA